MLFLPVLNMLGFSKLQKIKKVLPLVAHEKVLLQIRGGVPFSSVLVFLHLAAEHRRRDLLNEQ